MAKKLLVVESDPKFSKVLPLFFRDTDFEVEIASSVKEGLSFAKSSSPALVLLNLDVDGHKGWDLARDLKSSSSTRKIPLLLMSSEKDEAQIKADTSLNGWEGYIRKPFVKKAILAKVEEAMANAGDAGAEEELEIELDDALDAMGGEEKEEEIILVEEEPAPARAAPAAKPAAPSPPPLKVEVKEGASEPELRQAIRELERNVEAMRRDKERREKESRRLEETFKSKMDAKEKDVRDLESELEKKNAFASQISEQLKNLNDEVTQKEKGFRQESKGLRAERDELAEKVGRLGEECDAKKAEAADLSKGLAQAESHGTEVEKERDTFQGRIRELGQKATGLEGEIKALKAKIGSAREAMEKGLGALK